MILKSSLFYGMCISETHVWRSFSSYVSVYIENTLTHLYIFLQPRLQVFVRSLNRDKKEEKQIIFLPSFYVGLKINDNNDIIIEMDS